MTRQIPPRYLEPHQARKTPTTTPYEDLLGDSIERAFAQGLHTLDKLVSFLNQYGPPCPNGERWTEENYCEEMSRLGD